MREAEKAAFARGVSAEALMNEAGAGIAKTVGQFFPAAGRCLVFAGKGNNGVSNASCFRIDDDIFDSTQIFSGADCFAASLFRP